MDDITIIAHDLDLTSEQEQQLRRAADGASRIYPDDDLRAEREQVVSGAAQWIAGDSDLTSLSLALHDARRREAAALDQLRGAIIAAADTGHSEHAITKATGLSRTTVRNILGK